MKITITRFRKGKNSILSEICIDYELIGCGLEDFFRSADGKRRPTIPSGHYEVRLYCFGAMHARYHRKFAGMHKGILHITGDTSLKYVFILAGRHIGDTHGGLLVGQKFKKDGSGDFSLLASKETYTNLYSKVIAALEKGEEVLIEFKKGKSTQQLEQRDENGGSDQLSGVTSRTVTK